ncbi:MAG: hypothetical protein CME88_09055 [Hirschia sp.]|nr:hypothetical protein [Hirschia sp.]MBF18511.1 hypothetical protein [Hirschia sp.]|tara:strand:- start:173 stop:361 length:189 start_codon:yes stop_codon:yes gene_type:complete
MVRDELKRVINLAPPKFENRNLLSLLKLQLYREMFSQHLVEYSINFIAANVFLHFGNMGNGP